MSLPSSRDLKGRCVMDDEIALEPRRRPLFTAREALVIVVVSVAITLGVVPLIG